MRKTKFTEEQIAFAFKQAEAYTRVSEVCRKMGPENHSISFAGLNRPKVLPL